jgi:hypothetical protein
MKTPIRITLCALALAAWLRPTLADDKESPAVAKRTGHVLVMDNESTLEGDIELSGSQYCVRRQVGEVIIPPEKVLRLCQDREEAYLFLRQRANLRDPDERLRLARWCHQNGLKQQELDEVEAAVRLRPDHAPTVHLLRNLQRMMALAAEAKAPAKPAPEVEPALIAASVNSDSLSLFVTKVQPILMNTCATCHGSGRGGSFKLTRVFANSSPSYNVTRQNLAAAVAQVRSDRPGMSPLLVKSFSVHGDMAQPALKGVDSAAYRTLAEWVRITLEAGPVSPKDGSSIVATTRPEEEAPKASVEKTPPSSGYAEGSGEARDVAKPLGNAPVKTPVDPYDPEIFNRQLHPQGKPPGPNQ